MFTKTAFLLHYLISNLSLITCLQYTNCDDILLLFNNASELPASCEGKTVKAVACQAIFHMNYLTKEIHLNLTGGDDPKRNDLLDLSVQNKFDEPKIVDGNITYVCKTANGCAI
jgi:hypothetical protein